MPLIQQNCHPYLDAANIFANDSYDLEFWLQLPIIRLSISLLQVGKSIAYVEELLGTSLILKHTAHQCAKRDKMTSVTKRSYSMSYCFQLLPLLIKHISVPARPIADTKAKATICVVWPLWFNALISVLACERSCTG